MSPEVEKYGLVLPSLKRPHSGWSLLAHPFGDFAIAARSFQPICASGQPRAWAMGSGIAMTSGVCTSDGRSLGIGLARSRSVDPWSTSTAHELEAGLQTSGLGPSTFSSQPRDRAVAAAPLALVDTVIHMHVPSTFGLDALYRSASVPSSAAFSLEATIDTVVHPGGASAAGVEDSVGTPPASESLLLPPTHWRTTRTSARPRSPAMISGMTEPRRAAMRAS